MSYTPTLDPIFTGNVRVPTATLGDSDNTAASTAFVAAAVAAAISGISSDFVDLTTDQTIDGLKTFSQDVTSLGGIDVQGTIGTATGDLNIGYDVAGTPLYSHYYWDKADMIFRVTPATGNGDSQSPFTISAGGALSWGTGDDAPDTNLYRSGVGQLTTIGTIAAADATTSNELATLGQVESAVAAIDLSGYAELGVDETVTGAWTFDNNVVIDNAWTLTTNGGDVNINDTGALRFAGTSAAADIVAVRATGDTNDRFRIDASGTMEFGSGAGVADVTLTHTGTNVLSLGAGDWLRAPAAPVDGYDLANKAYVDGIAQGLQLKGSSRAATTANITLANEQTIDGVVLVAGDRVLVKNQTAAETNGIYVVVDGGAWTRAEDLDEPSELTAGIFTFVEEGTANGDKGFVLVSDNPIVLGTDPQVWTTFSAAAALTAGDGLVQVGNSFNVVGGRGITDNADDIVIDETVVATLDTNQTVDGLKTFTNNVVVQGSLLHLDGGVVIRHDAAAEDSGVLEAGATGDANFRFLLNNVGKLEWGNGTGAADTNLYRGAANQLKTDDAFYVGDQLDVAGAANILGVGGKTTLTIANGIDQGITIGDVNIYRSAANVLKTDDALHVTGVLQALGNADVDGTLTSGSTLTVEAGGATINGGVSMVNQATVGGTLTANSRLVSNAGQNVQTTTKTAAYSVNLATDYMILVDTATAGGGVTITLPADHTDGDIIVVKDTGGQAETKNVTVDTADADTIDGLNTFVMNINYMAVSFVSNGTNWFVV
jgi:hypothetical protein